MQVVLIAFEACRAKVDHGYRNTKWNLAYASVYVNICRIYFNVVDFKIRGKL